MDIVVALQLMPAAGEELELLPDGTAVDDRALTMVVNEFDDQALEEALIVKEEVGAVVTALALEAEASAGILRAAYARGADRAVEVTRPAGFSRENRAVALLFAAAVRELGADLVVTGVQTPFDIFGQLSPYLAYELGWPHIGVVSQLTVDGGQVRVLQEYGAGRAARIRVGLPLVVGIQAARRSPRYASITRIRQALTAGVPERIRQQPAQAVAPAVDVSLSMPRPERSAEILGGDVPAVASRLADILRSRGLDGGAS